MKKLYIIRHTKKENEITNGNDYDIELSKEGIEQAKIVALNFAKKNSNIDLILASPAKRTSQTAEIFAKELGYQKAIIYNEIFYKAYVIELLETLSYTYDNFNSIILIGHNPSLTALGVTLVGLKEKIPNGGILEIDFDCNNWIEISKNNAKLISFEKP